MVQSWSLCAEFIYSVLLLCSLRPEAVSGPRWFTIASAADLTGSFSLCLRIRLPYCSLITAVTERERRQSGNKGARGGGGKKSWGEKEERKRQRKIGPLPSRVIITISEFSMKRQQVEPNGKYADVCKCVLDGSPRGPVGD